MQIKQCVCQSAKELVINTVRRFRRISVPYLGNKCFFCILAICELELLCGDMLTVVYIYYTWIRGNVFED